MASFVKEFSKGITISNPIFILALGLCPALAISYSLDNALGMSVAVLFVLLGSNIIISATRRIVPNIMRIPIFIVIIATFVTLVTLVFQAYVPILYQSLGIYLPLIVVNCIILGRAEAFASKNRVINSIADALGIGLGFALALIVISLLREFLGTGGISISLFDQLFNTGSLSVTLPAFSEHPLAIFVLSPGAFLVIGLLMALFRWIGRKKND